MSDLIVPMAVLDWRDSQMEAISEQLEDAIPDLLARLDAWVDEASRWSLALAEIGPNADQRAIVDSWSAEQTRQAVRRAEEAMTDALRALPPDLTGGAPELATLLPAMAGVGLIAASVAALPTIISFATVTTSSLAFFSVTTVSWPLMVAGIAVAATAAAAGSTLLIRAEGDWRRRVKTRLRAWAYAQMLGLGAPRGARSFLSDLQAAIIRAGNTRMEERG